MSFIQLISMTANKNNKDLKQSTIQSILPMSDYILVYPAIQESSSLVFNFGFLVLCLCVMIFLIWGGFYINSVEN